MILGVIGPYIYGGWTRHAVHFEPVTFDLLLLVILANSVWYTSSVVPMASNQHQKIASAYMIGTLLSLGLALPLMRAFGITGAAAALLCIDCSMVWLVLRTALTQLSDTFGGFARSMLMLPIFGPLPRRVKGGVA